MHAAVAASPAFAFQTVTASPLAGAANAAAKIATDSSNRIFENKRREVFI
jgi:hypothetical protein